MEQFVLAAAFVMSKGEGASGSRGHSRGRGPVCNVVEEADISDAIEAMEFPGFGEQSDQESLCRVLLDNWEVLRPTTEVVKGHDVSIKLQEGVDVSWLNRVAFRKCPLEMEVEGAEMRKLLERGIVYPSFSPCGKSKVMVQKKKLPDGTSVGLRVTADMREVNPVTVGDDSLQRTLG
jgi:hypothetical protein